MQSALSSLGFFRPRSGVGHQSVDLTVTVGQRRKKEMHWRQNSDAEEQRKSSVAGRAERGRRRKCIRITDSCAMPQSHPLTDFSRLTPASRLTLNILRKFISFVSPFESVNFVSSCKAFSRLLREEQFAASMLNELKSLFLYTNESLHLADILDLERIHELALGGKRGKQFRFPAFIDIQHIDAEKGTFYSVSDGQILEGKLVMYNETHEMVRTRRTISNIIACDFDGDYIVAVNQLELALSYSEADLEFIRHRRTTVSSVRFLGNRQAIALAGENRVDIYEFSLRLRTFIEFSARIEQFFAPVAEEDVFAVVMETNTAESYSVKGSFVLLNSKLIIEAGRMAKEILFHKQETEGSPLLFSIVLLDSEELFINQKMYGYCFDVRLKDSFLMTNNRVEIAIFAVSSVSNSFELQQKYAISPEIRSWNTVEVWKTKALVATSSALYWCRSGADQRLVPVADFKFPELSPMVVKSFGEFVLVKGIDGSGREFVSVMHFSLSNSLDIRASLPKNR